MKSKTPKKSPEELALLTAQTRELARQEDQINERKARILRAQMGSRASLLSGGERRQTPGSGGSSTPVQSGLAGRSGVLPTRSVSLTGGKIAAGTKAPAPQAQKRKTI